jgi:hypothetical protein
MRKEEQQDFGALESRQVIITTSMSGFAPLGIGFLCPRGIALSMITSTTKRKRTVRDGVEVVEAEVEAVSLMIKPRQR